MSLKQRFRSWLFDEQNQKCMPIPTHGGQVHQDFHTDPSLQFRVFSAVGGRVVEFHRYDRTTDRSKSSTYIITEDQNFGEAIAKIATIEAIKQ